MTNPKSIQDTADSATRTGFLADVNTLLAQQGARAELFSNTSNEWSANVYHGDDFSHRFTLVALTQGGIYEDRVRNFAGLVEMPGLVTFDYTSITFNFPAQDGIAAKVYTFNAEDGILTVEVKVLEDDVLADHSVRERLYLEVCAAFDRNLTPIASTPYYLMFLCTPEEGDEDIFAPMIWHFSLTRDGVNLTTITGEIIETRSFSRFDVLDLKNDGPVFKLMNEEGTLIIEEASAE